MIWTIFILLGSTLAGVVVSILPESTGFSSEALASMTGISQYFYIFNQLIAIDTLLIGVGIVIAYELVIVGIHIIRWLINMIPWIKV